MNDIKTTPFVSFVKLRIGSDVLEELLQSFSIACLLLRMQLDVSHHFECDDPEGE
jgi:hypothetical protein